MKVVGLDEGSEVLKKLPNPPAYLGAKAKAHYKKIGKILIAKEILKNIHIPALEILSENFAQWEWAVREIRTKNRDIPGSGYIQIFDSGATNISTEITVKRDAEKAIMQCFKQFGIDPKSEKELNHQPSSQMDLLEALGLTKPKKEKHRNMRPTEEMINSLPFKYVKDVIEGNIITGKWIKLAAERFFTWIENAETDGFYLDHEDGMRIINFFPKLLNHTKGRAFAGKPFHLAPFQQFTLYNVFGWKNKDGYRRITKVYDKRAKKNGKTAEMAGVALYMMCLDDEPEAEVYIGATKEDQAKICWRQARQFIEGPLASPGLRHIGFYCKQREIIYKPTYSVLMPLGGDSKTQDGINSHCSIIDEYHAHANDSVKENLESSSIQRIQPLLYHITTAGTNIASACKRYEDVCKDILSGILEDPHTFIMIHDLDKDDDWEDEANWIKANPLLGQGLNIDRLRIEYNSAKTSQAKRPTLKPNI